MIECYFCKLGFTTWDFLALHLIEAHIDEVVAGRSLRMGWGTRVTLCNVMCWCKYQCTGTCSLGRHLEIHGGVEQHLFEIGLGIAYEEEQQ